MYTNVDWTRAISKLTRLTVEGKLSWKIEDDFGTTDGRTVDRCFLATHDLKTYVVYSYNQKIWLDDVNSTWESGFSFEVWQGDLFQPLQFKIASSPEVPSIINLFKTVEGQFAKDQDALGFLLSDD